MSTLAAAALAGIPAVGRAAVPSAGVPAGGGRYRVTVLRRECYADLQSAFLNEPESGPCPLFTTGQTIELDDATAREMVARGEFCGKAWECIKSCACAGAEGCDSRTSMTGVAGIACCSDGTRPVVFKVERV